MKWLTKLTSKSPRAKASDPSAASRNPATLKASDFISEKNIAFFPVGPSKQQVFGKLIGSLDLPDPTAAMKAILAREEAGSTIIVPGLALPHTRISGITKIAAAIGICPAGVVDHRAGTDPIHLFVLFVGPSDNMKDHLAFLASVSTLFQKEGLMDRLIHLSTPRDVMAAIREAEKSL